MLILASTSDLISVVTSAATNIDVQASWVDWNGTTGTPGRTNTAISTATTTTVIGSPGSSTSRAIKGLTIRNKDASNPNTITVRHSDGSTIVELYSIALSPGCSLMYTEDTGFFTSGNASSLTPPYYGLVAAAYGYGDVTRALAQVQFAGNVAATPTNITTSIARCAAFKLPFDLLVNKVRFYGVGAVTTTYGISIYNYNTLAQLSTYTTFTTAASTWGSVYSSLGLQLTANTQYFIAVSVNTTGTTAGIGCVGGTISSTTGQIATTPSGLPGNLQVNQGSSGYMFQGAVTSGVLPNPFPTPAAQSAWTGGMPLFFLDNSNA